jgi:hypothetical protein
MRQIVKVLIAVATVVLCIAWNLVDTASPYDASHALPLASHDAPAGTDNVGTSIELPPVDELLKGRDGEVALGPMDSSPPARVAEHPPPSAHQAIVPLTGSGWRPPSMQYAGAAFGTVLVAPIASSSDPWCASELLGSPTNASDAPYRYNPTCTEEPLHQGSFKSLADVLQFGQLPRVSPLSYLDVTDAEHQLYWNDNEDPYIAHCKACAGSLVHKTLYRARRWWRSRHWRKRSSAASTFDRMAGSFLGIHKDHFSSRRGSISTSGFDFEPFNTSIDTVVPFDDIARIQLCMSTTDSFMQFVLRSGGEIIMQQQSFLAGNRCFWRTLQLLFNNTLALRVFALPNETCTFSQALASGTRAVAENSTVALPLDRSFSFTPCYRNDITNLSRVIDASGMMGKRKNFWPFTCDYTRSTEQCGQRRRIQEASAGVDQNVKVAVALAGFVRSFSSARMYIYDHLIKPHGATLFGSVWNVVGRAKKTVDVTKKNTVRPGLMLNTLAPLFGIQPNETFRRLEVLEYFRHVRGHKVLQANGILHPGLYYTLARSLQLVYDSKVPFDIVIRSRFDIAPTIPLFFNRMQSVSASTGKSVVEYALDVGSSCHMDGVWWPQFAKFGEGKVLKHYADTRMKYFSWQVCDWMDIGTYETMKHFTTIFDWMIDGNVHSAAQFVDHAFFLDHNLTYFPMQLYLKILRHKGLLFG